VCALYFEHLLNDTCFACDKCLGSGVDETSHPHGDPMPCHVCKGTGRKQ